MSVLRRLVVVLALVLSAASLPALAGQLVASAADAPRLGATADTAAGSCWEIKQSQPAATDGAYWLLTPAMAEPQQFYCDMTTNGGGWVLVGQGREGWTIDFDGKGDASGLLSPSTIPLTTTVQLPSTTVQALMNGGRVDALSDGVRMRRATNAAGSAWQEVRVKYSKWPQWSWTFGAENPVASWSFDSTAGTGGSSASFGTGNALTLENNTTVQSNTYKVGFAFGTSVTGSTSDSSYLWSATDGGGSALPETQVFIRPKTLSNDAGFTAIGDGGLGGYAQQSMPKSQAIASPWGVSGLAGTTSTEGNVEVQSFTQSGNTMFVGGNFKYVQQDAAGTGQVNQPFLAAFDVTTGAYLPSFRPVLNEQVHDLATLPNGDVVAGGEFTQANGQAATGIVALNPSTGATDTSWSVTLQDRLAGDAFRVNGLDVFGDYLYIAGAVTHYAGGSKPNAFVYSRGLGRVSVANGTPDPNWKPTLNGTATDVSISPDGSTAYASGYFTTANGVAAVKAAAISTATGAVATPWSATWSSSNNYQRTVDAVGSKVWVGGSEHSLFQFDPATLNRTMGDIGKPHGDIQAIGHLGNVVFAGCHCDDWVYHNAYAWPNLTSDWTSANALRWLGAWDATTGTQLPSFTPNLEMRQGTGIWAIAPDSTGVLWAGGDVVSAATSSQAAAFAGGFVRFPLNDSTAPTTPSNLSLTSSTSSTATLSWSGSTDAGGGVHYVVLRDDRPIAATAGNLTSITVPLGGSSRFFVRAVDKAGNYSATTSVLAVSGTHVPPTASFTSNSFYSTVGVDGSASTGNGSDLVDYLWDFGDGSGARGAIAEHTYAAAGTYIVKLTVTDSTGATGTTSQTVTVTNAANPSPTDPYGKLVYSLSPSIYYRLGEATGSLAKDSGPEGRDGTYVNTLTRGTPGVLTGSTDTAVTSDGTQGFVTSPRLTAPPTTFSTTVWFKTTSTSGGRLIGYSGSNTGPSSNYDRHIFMQNDGSLVFGVWTGQENRVTSAAGYNNGKWHQAVATLSPTDGMKLYVDGQLAGQNANGSAENFVGYWRVGGDNLWGGASSAYLAGSLDEAAVFPSALTATQVSSLFAAASATNGPPPGTNVPPTASFASTVSNQAAQLDGSGSTDSDGTVKTYAWDFGDGATGSGQIVNHTYAQAQTYTVTLTVTDNGGATATATHTVTTTATPVDSTVIAKGSSWRWKYDATAPPAGWNSPGFDASGWSSGNAVLGFGSTGLGTNIDTFASTSDRPITAYFVRQLTVPSAAKARKLVLTTVADDGVVVYVNGTEVGRSNMPAGAVTNKTYASSARRTAVATSAPYVVEVPTSLLVDGTNTVSVETHLNFRATADASFDLSAVLTAVP